MNMSQEYELTEQTTATATNQFSHSAKLTSTTKGVRIDVHCYGSSSEEVRQQLLKTFVGIETDLRNHCITIAPMGENNLMRVSKEVEA